MTLTLFVIILTFGSAASALVTEAFKKAFSTAHMNYSCNLLALIDAVLVGGFGTTMVYCFMDIPFTTNNLLCVVCMMICIWIGSMIGYDKVIQLVNQIKGTV